MSTTPPTPTELDAAIERLEALVADGPMHNPTRRLDQLATGTVLSALKEARNDTALLLSALQRQGKEADAARLMVLEWLTLAPDLAQLLQGWHADGTAWSAWDQSVYEHLLEIQTKHESGAAIDSAMSARSDEKGRQA
jgi:hypothetical protein